MRSASTQVVNQSVNVFLPELIQTLNQLTNCLSGILTGTSTSHTRLASGQPLILPEQPSKKWRSIHVQELRAAMRKMVHPEDRLGRKGVTGNGTRKELIEIFEWNNITPEAVQLFLSEKPDISVPVCVSPSPAKQKDCWLKFKAKELRYVVRQLIPATVGVGGLGHVGRRGDIIKLLNKSGFSVQDVEELLKSSPQSKRRHTTIAVPCSRAGVRAYLGNVDNVHNYIGKEIIVDR